MRHLRSPAPGCSAASVAMNIFRLTGDLSHLAAIIILLLKIWKSRSCAGVCGRPPGGRGERGGAGPGRAEGWAPWPPPRCRLGPGGAGARLCRSVGAALSLRRGPRGAMAPISCGPKAPGPPAQSGAGWAEGSRVLPPAAWAPAGAAVSLQARRLRLFVLESPSSAASAAPPPSRGVPLLCKGPAGAE